MEQQVARDGQRRSFDRDRSCPTTTHRISVEGRIAAATCIDPASSATALGHTAYPGTRGLLDEIAKLASGERLDPSRSQQGGEERTLQQASERGSARQRVLRLEDWASTFANACQRHDPATRQITPARPASRRKRNLLHNDLGIPRPDFGGGALQYGRCPQRSVRDQRVKATLTASDANCPRMR